MRKGWRKINGYEVFNWPFCLECKHFTIDTSHPFCGDCELMKQEGEYPGVMTQAVCNRFLSTKGTDINGRVIDPSMLPAWVKTRKTKTSPVFVVD
jgi:hypothetical protein